MRRFSSYGPLNTKSHYYASREKLIQQSYTQLTGDKIEFKFDDESTNYLYMNGVIDEEKERYKAYLKKNREVFFKDVPRRKTDMRRGKRTGTGNRNGRCPGYCNSYRYFTLRWEHR